LRPPHSAAMTILYRNGTAFSGAGVRAGRRVALSVLLGPSPQPQSASAADTALAGASARAPKNSRRLQYPRYSYVYQKQMKYAASLNGTSRMTFEQDRRISDVVKREQSRLRNFIRRRVPDPRDADDILQEVFSELVEANRLLMPIEHVTGWLFRVARNRITDLFRKKQPERFSEVTDDDDELLHFEDLLPSPDAGPEALYLRQLMFDDLALAIGELPAEQRAVFVAHEIEGRSFNQIAADTGVNLNTLLARKRYAVLHLRRRLHDIYEEFLRT
jgi:RNA polymerase sigma factor (sigma-70 family)